MAVTIRVTESRYIGAPQIFRFTLPVSQRHNNSNTLTKTASSQKQSQFSKIELRKHRITHSFSPMLQILMSAKLELSAKTTNSASIHTVLTGALLK